MLDPKDIERAFQEMGLGTKEDRDRFLNLTNLSLPSDADEEQLFIKLSHVTHPQPPKEASGAELERHTLRDQ